MDPSILREFGLTANESSIFLALARKGLLSPAAIARETGLNRPYTYYALERLLEKGFVSQIRVQGRQCFQAISAEQISRAEEHKLEMLQGFLHGLQQTKGGEVTVEVLKGKYVVKNVFKTLLADLHGNEEHLCLGVDESVMESLEPLYLQKVLRFFQQHNITDRAIIKEGGRTLPYAKTTIYRFLEPALLGNTARFIYQQTVIDIIYGDPTYAILIRSRELAETARKQFGVFWKLARKGPVLQP